MAGLEPPSYRPAQQTEVLFDTSSNDNYPYYFPYMFQA